MSVQAALPGLDALGEARAELARLDADWETAQARYRAERSDAHWAAIVRLHPLRRAALVRVDRLASGRDKWWY